MIGLKKINASVTPTANSQEEAAEMMSDFFIHKIDKLCSGSAASPQHEQYETVSPKLNKFKPVTKEEIKKLILQAPSKSCPLDPMPTELLKKCVDQVTPSLAEMVKKSFETGVVPDCVSATFDKETKPRSRNSQ
ncbi:hypothetical protein SNE40_001646 [Patella caerulea]|uniref:Uncharacterized protein n=1 Tax=Patella caerulea TaxID=87958 RepID=A0AAN8KI35_PATCE